MLCSCMNDYASLMLKVCHAIRSVWPAAHHTCPQVKLLKCLVDNLVVDVSFNQLGGLCALNFLEEINRNLQPEHMLKKSIILVGRATNREGAWLPMKSNTVCIGALGASHLQAPPHKHTQWQVSQACSLLCVRSRKAACPSAVPKCVNDLQL